MFQGPNPLDCPLVAGTSQLPSPIVGFIPSGPLGPRSLDLNPMGWGDQAMHYPPPQSKLCSAQPLCSQRTTSTNPFLRAMPSSSSDVSPCSTRMQGTVSHALPPWPVTTVPVKRGKQGRRKPVRKTIETPNELGKLPTGLTTLGGNMCKLRTSSPRRGRRKPKQLTSSSLEQHAALQPGDISVVSEASNAAVTANDPVTLSTIDSYLSGLENTSTSSMQTSDLQPTCTNTSPAESSLSLYVPDTSGYVDRRKLPRELARISSDASFVNATPAALFDPQTVSTLGETRLLRRRPAPPTSIIPPQRKSRRLRQPDGPPARNLRGYHVDTSSDDTEDSMMLPPANPGTSDEGSVTSTRAKSGCECDEPSGFKAMDLAVVCVKCPEPPSLQLKPGSMNPASVQSEESTVSPDSLSLTESVTNTVSSGSDTVPLVEGTTDNLSLCGSACTGSTESYTIEYSVPEYKDETPSPVEENQKEFLHNKSEQQDGAEPAVIGGQGESTQQPSEQPGSPPEPQPSSCGSGGDPGCSDGNAVGTSTVVASSESTEEADMDGMPTLQPETSDTDAAGDDQSPPPLTAPALECQSSNQDDSGSVCTNTASLGSSLAISFSSSLEVITCETATVTQGFFQTQQAHFQTQGPSRPQIQPADSTQSQPPEEYNLYLHPPEKTCIVPSPVPPQGDLLVSSSCSTTAPNPIYGPLEETGTSVNVVALACRHNDVLHMVGRKLSEATVSSSACVDDSIPSVPFAPLSTCTLPPWEPSVVRPAATVAVLPPGVVGLCVEGPPPVYGAGVVTTTVGQCLYPLPPTLLAHGHFQVGTSARDTAGTGLLAGTWFSVTAMGSCWRDVTLKEVTELRRSYVTFFEVTSLLDDPINLMSYHYRNCHHRNIIKILLLVNHWLYLQYSVL